MEEPNQKSNHKSSKPPQINNNNLLRMAKIHETAVVHPRAEIAKNVEIGPYTTIGDKVSIKENTVIGAHVNIKGETDIGKDNEIYHGTALGLVSNPELSSKKLVIGNNNIIRENVTIYRGPKCNTVIGDNNFIMAYCHFAEGCRLGANIVISNAAHFSAKVKVGDNAVIAGLSLISSGVKIGNIAMIGAHSRVDENVPPYLLVDGHPAQIKNINVIGLRRNGFKPALRKKIKKVFKIMYHSDLELEQALYKIKNKMGDIEKIKEFINFFKK